MTYTFSLSQADYLNFQLFFASTVQNAHVQRKNSQIIWTLVFLLMAFNFYAEKKLFPAVVFLIFGVSWTIFYPVYAKNRQQKHFEKYNNTFLSEKFDKVCTITIDDQIIHSVEENYESKIALSEVKQVYETGDYFYAHLKSGQTFIFPRQKIENINALEDQLRDITAKNQVSFTEMTDWKW